MGKRQRPPIVRAFLGDEVVADNTKLLLRLLLTERERVEDDSSDNEARLHHALDELEARAQRRKRRRHRESVLAAARLAQQGNRARRAR